jgi:hypothetical protein
MARFYFVAETILTEYATLAVFVEYVHLGLVVKCQIVCISGFRYRRKPLVIA